MTESIAKLTFKISLTSLNLPSVRLSDTIFDTATGSPAVAMMKRRLYIVYDVEKSPIPSSPRIYVSGILKPAPMTFTSMFAATSISAPFTNV